MALSTSPRIRVAVLATSLLSASLVAACADKPDTDAARQVIVPVDTPMSPRPGDPDCPRDGLWKPCALVDRIVRAGLAPRITDDTMRVSYLDVPGLRYRVGRSAMLTAFFYADSNAALRQVAGIDTVTLRAPGDSVSPWGAQPVFIRSANLIAILESENPQQIERVKLAITAGTP